MPIHADVLTTSINKNIWAAAAAIQITRRQTRAVVSGVYPCAYYYFLHNNIKNILPYNKQEIDLFFPLFGKNRLNLGCPIFTSKSKSLMTCPLFFCYFSCFFRFTVHLGLGFYILFVQYYSVICCPSEHIVGRPRAENRTRDGRYRGKDSNH